MINGKNLEGRRYRIFKKVQYRYIIKTQKESMRYHDKFDIFPSKHKYKNDIYLLMELQCLPSPLEKNCLNVYIYPPIHPSLYKQSIASFFYFFLILSLHRNGQARGSLQKKRQIWGWKSVASPFLYWPRAKYKSTVPYPTSLGPNVFWNSKLSRFQKGNTVRGT